MASVFHARGLRRLPPGGRRCLTGAALGISLLEVLIALSLAGGLMALGLAAAPHLARRASEARARAELAILASALDAYRREFGELPRTEGLPSALAASEGRLPPGTAEEALREALLGRLDSRLRPTRTRPWIGVGGFAEIAVGEPVPGTGDRARFHAVAAGVFADPWGRPYRYACQGAGLAPRLYSHGFDGEDGETGDPRTEDNLYALF